MAEKVAEKKSTDFGVCYFFMLSMKDCMRLAEAIFMLSVV